MGLILTRPRAPVQVATALAFACALVGFGAVTAPRATLYATAAMALCILAARNVVALLAVFVILTFPETLPLGIASGTVAKPLGALLVGSWALYLLESRRRDLRLRRSPAAVTSLAVFFGFALSSALWATDASTVFSNLSRLLQMVLLFLIIISVVRTQHHLFVVAAAYVCGSTATAAYALGSGITLGGRLTGGVGNSNSLAAAFGAAILLAGFMLAAAHGFPRRAALLASIGINGVALVLTQSRGGTIALAAGLVAAAAIGGRWRSHAVGGGLVAVAVGALYFFAVASPAVQARLTNISAQGSSGRADEWRIAYRIFEGHPVAGAGLGNYSVLAPHYATATLQLLRVQFVLKGFVAHNTYLQVLSELGMVGITLFAIFILGVVARGMRALMGPLSTEVSALGRGAIVALLSILVADFFGSGLFLKPLWILLGLTSALPTLVADKEQQGVDVS